MRKRPLNNPEHAAIARNEEDAKNRQRLLGGVRPLQLHHQRKHRNEQYQAHKNTKKLGSLVVRMSEQVQISDHANLILTTSSGTLRDTGTHMEAIGATIRSGGKLITKYGRRETTDKILLTLALLLYFGVIVYILKKRMFTFRFPELW